MSEHRTIAEYGRALWNQKRVVFAAVVCCLTASVVMLALQDRVYQGEAEMLVELRTSTGVFDDGSTFRAADLERAVQTEIQIIEGTQVRQRVADTFGLATLPPAAKAVSVQNTDVIRVRVRSVSAQNSATLANAYVDAYGAIRREAVVAELDRASAQLQSKIDDLTVEIDDLQAQIEGAGSESDAGFLDQQRVRLVDQRETFLVRLNEIGIETALAPEGATLIRPAETPESPVSPQPIRTLLLAFAAGLALGAGTALLLETMDNRVRSMEDLETLISPVPVLASVPVTPDLDDGSIALVDPTAPSLEAIRALRTNLTFLGIDSPMTVIHVTSSLPGEGKTTVASDLAVVLAHAGGRVVAIDGDLRKPRLHKVFGVDASSGLSSVLAGGSLDDAVFAVNQNLDVIPCGPLPPNPSELLGSKAMADLVDRLRNEYDHVVVDSPPVLPVADSLGIARHVDGVILVCQSGRTARDDARRALAALRQVGAPVVGAVLNRSDGSEAYAYSYAYSQ